MDNEEIRKLLQELKETSDTGKSVRSKVVKIHFDTPEETEKKARAKRRAEQEAQRRRLEEEAREQAREEARRREAEKAARSAVEEAKLQAQAEFSSDLEHDLLKAAGPADAVSEEEALKEEALEDLNWDFNKRRRTGDLVRELEEAEAGLEETVDAAPDDTADANAGEASGEEEKESAASVLSRILAPILAIFASMGDALKELFGRVKDKAPAREKDADIGEETEVWEDDEDWKRAMELPPSGNLKKRSIPEGTLPGEEKKESWLDRLKKRKAAAPADAEEEEPASDPQTSEEAEPDDVAAGKGGPDESASLTADDFPDAPDASAGEPLNGEDEGSSADEPLRGEDTESPDDEVLPGEEETSDGASSGKPAAGRKKKRAQNAGDSFKRFFSRVRGFVGAHQKGVLIGAGILALAIIAAIALSILIPKIQSRRHARITKDEGLTVQVLEQPSSFTTEGDVKLRIKAPETIQSVTVNGQNVAIENGRTVDLSYHAQVGTLELMVVSTDKVRNAKVILAFVDSQPPTVTVTSENGQVSFAAEDEESGVKNLYVGTFDGISEVPMYEVYSEPMDEDPDRRVSYYAVDQAGNSSVPVTIALTQATSIAFQRERYGLFPGEQVQLNLVTTPADAFVNDLNLSTEDPHVAVIDGGTTLRGTGEGDTQVTASASGLKSVTAAVSVAQSRSVTVSAIGDCTLGTDINLSPATSFDAYQSLYGNGYFFEKVKGLLSEDDLTFANLEGTLTTSDQRAGKQFAFKGDPSNTEILTLGSVEAVNLANNHTEDYGAAGLSDTKAALEAAGIDWCLGDDIAYRDVNGALVAMIGIYSLDNGVTKLDQVQSTVAEAKEKGADLIIVEFHWGNELVAEVDEYQKTLAHAAVDAGAGLVLGSHAHVLQGIEKYNGAYIVYGLSNFCFGGNSVPNSYDSMIFRQTFTFTSGGLENTDDISIIPCRISTDPNINNYQPTPVGGDQAKAIMDRLDELSAEFGLTVSPYMRDGTQAG